MDKVEELFPQLVEYLKEDLAKEHLTSKTENRRLELIRSIEKAFQESAAKKINAKYEHPQSTDDAPFQRRSAIFRGNILPTPFTSSSVEAKHKDETNDSATKRISIAAYEELSSYQIPVSAVYEEVGKEKSYDDDDDVSSGPVNTVPTYEDPASFFFAPERIAEAPNSDSGTDYEEYGNEDPTFNKDPNAKESKKNSKVRREVTLGSLRFSGSLHQKGSFHQHRRRLCGIRGATFVCCKNDASLKVVGKADASFKVVLELALAEYEVVHQERRDAKSSYSQELRFSCPGKETHLFYADSKQDADNWVKELRKATALNKKDSLETNADDVTSLTDNYDNESENSETNISGGSVDKNSIAKILGQHQPAGDDARSKKSKLQTILVTVGKKLGNKTKTLLQQAAADFGNPQQMDGKPDSGGYLSIRSEEYTGDRWFKRFCRIEDGRLNCYKDQETTDTRPEFGLVLRGAQLKHIGDKDELKVTIVKDKMEHCLKMENFMDHGKWLVALIHETGFARQLAEESKMSPMKDYPQDPEASLYEEVGKFLTLDDVTLDESCPDYAPPPLPVWSPPASPCVGERLSSGKKAGGGGGGGGGGESIYLEPAGWLKDVEEIKNKKKATKNQDALKVSTKEESLYINRDCLLLEDKKSKEKRKGGEKDKSPMVSSNSFPSLVSLGLTDASNGNEAKRGGGKGGGGGVVVKRNDVTSEQSKQQQQQQQRFRPSSALVEFPDSLTEIKIGERKNIRGQETNISLTKSTKGATSENKDLSSSSASSQERKQDGCRVKTSHSYRDIVGYDMNRINRSRRTDSVSSEDLSSSTLMSDYNMNTKKMVQDLVKIFERST